MDQKDALNKQEPIKRVSKQRGEGQKSGMAGEFFVAAEPLKRNLQTSKALGVSIEDAIRESNYDKK